MISAIIIHIYIKPPSRLFFLLVRFKAEANVNQESHIKII